MTARHSPTIRQRRLIHELRRLRLGAGLSQQDVATEMEWSTSKQEKLETGAIGVRVQDLRGLLELFGVPVPEREPMLELCRAARERGWWHAYGTAVPPWLGSYLDFEQEATSIRTFEIHLVHGLLQTADYARAVLRARCPEPTAREVERQVCALLERQVVLTRPGPLQVRAILDEGALLRQVGGCGVMRAQLEHLATLAGLPGITVQVLPGTVGAHASMGTGFALLDFPQPTDHPIVFLEGHTDGTFLEDPDDVRHHAMVFDRLASSALPGPESARLIEQSAGCPV